ncbi:hypothetical protein LCGC14_1499870 [marine sediment metagenome]|uniref:Uncharacterized protein n=1 Tax=marine sediment metagenome TaxID=412755 RepID=A0A0F9LK21_9ZZZZ
MRRIRLKCSELMEPTESTVEFRCCKKDTWVWVYTGSRRFSRWVEAFDRSELKRLRDWCNRAIRESEASGE